MIEVEAWATLFRPVDPAQFALRRRAVFSRWAPRLTGQPIFYPVTKAVRRGNFGKLECQGERLRRTDSFQGKKQFYAAIPRFIKLGMLIIQNSGFQRKT